MKLFVFALVVQFFTCVSCSSDVQIGYQVTLAVPVAYTRGFTGRAFLMEIEQMVPNFRVALSVEAVDKSYSCSLDVFLGDVRVWSSGHLSRFYTMDRCALELTLDGDLRLKGQNDKVGWRTGTFGQGVKRLNLLKTGNLVLVDALDIIIWQSFNFPTDIMVWGQRLDVETRLTSFPKNSNSFYSFEIQRDKIALYLNSGKWKFSYWEFKPSKNRNITFVGLATKALEIYNDEGQKIAQIPSRGPEPLRFLALGNKTGNLGLYHFSPGMGKFEASFQALNATCDLPLACKPYGICTFSNTCSCIRLITRGEGSSSDCSEGIPEGFCGRHRVEMLDLQGVSSILRATLTKVNITSKEVCADLCIDDCTCVAALHTSGQDCGVIFQECALYGEVRGVKQVERGSGSSYMVKVLKGSHGGHGKSSGLKKWVLIGVGVGDGLIIILVLGGVGYYVIHKRRNYSSETGNNSPSENS
ncbi:hypothetical protein RJ639_005992 [Escallonia herrerae]|uniref:Bulb-type lectin domain-containing protein n=1 Tax=Escallonia herrerae TaxID=1293975 RepID=A0AA89AWX3_9ASTE|nr:hypothetical protein RJ639_005992 [Escallonia herrerae]